MAGFGLEPDTLRLNAANPVKLDFLTYHSPRLDLLLQINNRTHRELLNRSPVYTDLMSMEEVTQS